MGTTTPDNFPYPDGPVQIGRLHSWFKNLAEAVQLAINSLTSEHIEFTSTTGGLGNSGVYGVGALTMDASKSTSPGLAVASGGGDLTIVKPGVYAISSLTKIGAVATGRTYLSLYEPGDVIMQRMSINVNEDIGSLSIANYRVVNPNQKLLFQISRVVGNASVGTETRIRVTKLGRI